MTMMIYQINFIFMIQVKNSGLFPETFEVNSSWELAQTKGYDPSKALKEV